MARIIIWMHGIVGALMWPPSFALPNTLRAAGDTRFVLLSSMASMWIMRVGLGILMGTVWGIGLLGIWIAMLADWAVRIALFVPRFLGHRWETKGIKE